MTTSKHTSLQHVPVLIVGGGPVGLGLAIDLGWRGIECMLVEQGDGVVGRDGVATGVFVDGCFGNSCHQDGPFIPNICEGLIGKLEGGPKLR